MKATDVLRDEHAGIERMLNVVEAAAQRVRQGQQVPPDVFRDATEFFRNFTDGCHHAKEEEQLFPSLEQHGIPREGGPIAVMLAEHERGRALVRTMAAAIGPYAADDPKGQTALAESALGYVELLRQHIFKENNILFPISDQVLSPTEQNQLYDAFEMIERERTGPGEHERYHHMIEDWERKAEDW